MCPAAEVRNFEENGADKVEKKIVEDEYEPWTDSQQSKQKEQTDEPGFEGCELRGEDGEPGHSSKRRETVFNTVVRGNSVDVL